MFDFLLEILSQTLFTGRKVFDSETLVFFLGIKIMLKLPLVLIARFFSSSNFWFFFQENINGEVWLIKFQNFENLIEGVSGVGMLRTWNLLKLLIIKIYLEIWTPTSPKLQFIFLHQCLDQEGSTSVDVFD